MTWFDILKELEFKGGIVYKIPMGKLAYNISNVFDPPLDHTQLTSFHLTLLSPKDMKPFKAVHGLSNKEAKLKVRELIEEFDGMMPISVAVQHGKLSFGKHSVAVRGEVETGFLPINQHEQSIWQTYIDELANHLGIPRVKRFFHVSISNNQGGNPYKSIGDINESDLE